MHTTLMNTQVQITYDVCAIGLGLRLCIHEGCVHDETVVWVFIKELLLHIIVETNCYV